MAIFGPGINQAANQAAVLQQQLSDMQQARTIHTQIAAEARKSAMERWSITQQLQTKIHEMTATVTVDKAKMASKAFKAMEGYVKS